MKQSAPTLRADPIPKGTMALVLATAVLAVINVQLYLVGAPSDLILLAAILAAILGSLAIFFQPFLGLLFLALVIPLEMFQVIPGLNITMTKLLGVALVGALGFQMLAGGIRGIRRSPFDLPMLGFVAICLLSILWARDKSIATVQAISLTSYAVSVYLCTTLVTSKHRMLALYATLWFSVVGISFFYVMQAFGIGPRTVEDVVSYVGGRMVTRATGTSANTAVFAIFPLFGAALSLGLLRMGFAKPLRLVFLGAVVVCAAAVYLTYTRSSYLGLAAIFTAYAWIFSKQKTIWIPLFFLGVAGVLLYLPADILKHFATGFTFEEESAGMRLLQYKIAWPIFLDHWLLGVGIYNTGEYLIGAQLGYEINYSVLHSLPYTILLETGLVGFLFANWLIATVFIRILRAFRTTADPVLKGMVAATLLGFIGFLVHNFFHNILYVSLLGMVGGLAAASYNYIHRSSFASPHTAAHPAAALRPRPLRVLLLAEAPDAGGANSYVVNLANSFRDSPAVDCRVATLSGRSGDQWLLERARQESLSCDVIAMHRPFDLAAIVRLSSYARRHRIDIIHANGLRSGVVASLVSLLGGGHPKALTTMHGNPTNFCAGFKWRFYEWLDRATMAGRSALIAVSQQTRDKLQAAGYDARKITVIHNLVLPESIPSDVDPLAVRGELGLRPDDIVIAYAGRLVENKGLEELIELLPRLRERFPAARLLLIGGGALRPALEQRARELAVQDCVLFTGVRGDAVRLLAAADIFVLFSKSEELPISVIEAGMMGVPVVATRVGGLPELVPQGCGILLEDRRIEGLQSAMHDLLQDAERRREMGRALQAHISSKFVGNMAEQVGEVYCRIAGRRRRT